MSITHIWPYNEFVNAGAQPFSDEREVDVWDELRDFTFDDDTTGKIWIALHDHDYKDWDRGTCIGELAQDDFVVNRVQYIKPRDVEYKVHRPATEARTYTFTNLGTEGTTTIEALAEPERDELIKKTTPWNLGSKIDAQNVIKGYRNHEIVALVLWYPNDSEHLTHLSMVKTSCPDLPIYVFHCDHREDKYGVEREGRAGGSLWDTQSDLMEDSELQPVIEHIANQGESTWLFGPPKQGKTFILLCVTKALLTGESLFNVERLRVPHPSKRVIYLCPEAGRSSLRKRLKMLGLIEQMQDPITNPEGRLYLRSLSKGPKLNLDNEELLALAKGADIFIDTAIRYVDGDENNATDVKQMTEKILNLIAAGARSMWVAHHSGKSFASATEITLENCARGSTEFAASLTNAIGIVQLDKDKNLIHFHFIDGRDMDEPATDMHLQGRPYLSQIGNFQVTENVERFKGRNNKSGPKNDPDRQAKIDFAKSLDGSLQDKATAVNEKFGSKHSKSTVSEWLKGFDQDQEVA